MADSTPTLVEVIAELDAANASLAIAREDGTAQHRADESEIDRLYREWAELTAENTRLRAEVNVLRETLSILTLQILTLQLAKAPAHGC